MGISLWVLPQEERKAGWCCYLSVFVRVAPDSEPRLLCDIWFGRLELKWESDFHLHFPAEGAVNRDRWHRRPEPCQNHSESGQKRSFPGPSCGSFPKLQEFRKKSSSVNRDSQSGVFKGSNYIELIYLGGKKPSISL